MNKRKLLLFVSMILTVAVLSGGNGPGWAQQGKGQNANAPKGNGKITLAERKAAAARARALGLKPGVAGKLNVVIPAPDAPDGPGGVPHYFGPFGNWAYSPLPKGPIGGVTLDVGGAGYSAGVTLDILDVYGTGTGATVRIASVDGTGAITGFDTLVPGSNYTAPYIDFSKAAGPGGAPITGTDAAATATLNPATVTGGITKFIDRLPQLGSAGANLLVTPNRLGAGPASTDGQYIPVAVSENFATPKLAVSDYYVIALVEFYEKMHTNLPPTRHRGYVQLQTPANTSNPSNKHIALTYLNGSPIYYPATTTQVIAFDYPHFLGPAIVAHSNTPVRIKFYNLLPAGAADSLTGSRPGDLFLPVDETVAGSGVGPAGPGTAGNTFTQNRAAVHLHGNNTVWISDGTPHQWITPANETTPYPKGVSVRNVPDMPDPGPGAETLYYTNAMSARLMFYHDHAMGITRLNVYAGEAAGYVITDQVDEDMYKGTNLSLVNNVTATNSPLDPGQTNAKVLPGIGIPLVIQDRTWVDESTIWAQDPTWNWGTGARAAANKPAGEAIGRITAAITGDLWYPHVYMSAQNPWDLAGANAFGRWHYGPWFINQTPVCVNGLPVGCIDVGPVANPYYGTAPWEPPQMPGTPNPSTPGEAFMDTPIVNGTAYPYLDVEPKAYRFRILNASNDRFVNLQLYVAANKATPTTAGSYTYNPLVPPANLCTGVVAFANCTEVNMVPVSVAPANQQADWPSGIPDPTTKGPDWWQIGTEGGFLPAPVVIPQQPIGWNLNPTTFNYGVVNQHSLLLGSAERADVVVDFSAFAGKTLILYNDAPAAFPAGVGTYDYYTGVADQTGAGGAPTTLPGYGPNTRTIMQIRVAAAAAAPLTPDVTLPNLQTVFAKNGAKRGVFEKSQDPIIVPQAAYNSAYDAIVANPVTAQHPIAGFDTTAAGQYAQLPDAGKTFQPINDAGVLQPAITMPLEMKGMHDEMGGVYDTQFGRMSGMLGLTNPFSAAHILTPYGYASPPTDIHAGSVSGSQIGSLPDGTQIWRIFHNGVDTHTIHVHLFNAQLLNRVGQDGLMLPPDPNELGWKDTFRVNPLEVTYIAMRPIIPTQTQVPFEVPDSVRLIDPTLPEGATLIAPPPAGWFDPAGIGITEILNHYVNFGWEYVWHCHILAHEEMDMMHSLVFAVPPTEPTLLSAIWNLSATNPRVTLGWTDNSIKEAKYLIQRATNAGFTTGLATIDPKLVTTATTGDLSFVDATVPKNSTVYYRIVAVGVPVGDTQAYPAPSLGFPTMSVDSFSATSAPILIGTQPAGPLAPTLLQASVISGPRVSLTWTDNATNETGFVVERCTGAGCTNFVQIATPGPRNNTGSVTYVDTTVTAGNTYSYRVKAINLGGSSAYFPTPPQPAVNAVVPAPPAAPTSFIVNAVKANGNNYTAMLAWTYTPNPGDATNPTNFTIERANNSSFTTGLATFTAAGNLRTLTQTVNRNTIYYYRIRANTASGSSAPKNALPFPILTGN